MTYDIEQTDTETTIRIFSNGEIYRTHTFRSDIEDPELIPEVLLNDARIDKEREGEPK